MSALLDVVRAGSPDIFDLSVPMKNGMAKAGPHPEFRLTQGRRHGDHVREDGTSGSSEVIQTGGHVGTHVDALGHISWNGKLYGGLDAVETQRAGHLTSLGIDDFAPVVARGLLLDVAASHDQETLPAAYGITVADLEAAAADADVEVGEGDVVFVRTGWMRNFDDPVAYLGHQTGTPGLTEEGARWLADAGVAVTGTDTIHYEQIHPKVGAIRLPVHRLLLVERGINIVEIANLEPLAGSGVHEFVAVVAPINMVGATGSPARLLGLR